MIPTLIFSTLEDKLYQVTSKFTQYLLAFAGYDPRKIIGEKFLSSPVFRALGEHHGTWGVPGGWREW